MKLHAYLENGPRAGVLDETGRLVRPVPALDGGIDLALAEGRFEAALEEARATSLGSEPFELALVQELEPLPAIEFPGKIVCIGLNYRDHLAEQHLEIPDRPTLFAKFGNSIVGDGEPIVRPEGTHALDLEVELGVVVGRRARRVRADAAMEHVAGYVVLNDVSARDWQGNRAALGPGERGDGQWLRAKGSDTFLPVGSTFVTADGIDDPHDLRLRSWRIPGAGGGGGEPIAMQDGTTADMVWRIPQLIEFVSRAITLEPGDLIATGTPSGVGVFRDPAVFLQPGDRVRCEIEGIGRVENPVVDWSEVRDEPDDAEAVR
ncbi:MAG TPA: fumarylacetoacetate hydrolase family protein [Candidatus Limnocylindrales bacterium]|nr:fumarylacetoacetate hydrolase family protein [Candidatus Limnocylindrales bacterium]